MRDPLDEASLRADILGGGGVWSDLRVLARTGSTNADAIAAARAGQPEGLVILAEEQTAGRGRLGRDWQAPAGAGITMSVLLRPSVGLKRIGWLSLLTGVATVEAVQAATGEPALLKWPNDLLVGQPWGKCAGILAEVAEDAASGVAVVVGLGLNVDQGADELPPAQPDTFPPTSLALAGGKVEREVLVRAILASLSRWYLAWTDVGGDPDACGLRAAYADRCLTIGRHVTVSLPGGASVAGRATGVDPDGRLVVDGQALAAGDVHHVR